MSTTATLPVPAPPATPAPNPKPNILDSALLLIITRRWLPMTKTVNSHVVNSTADKKMLSVNKKLFDSPELKAIASNQIKLDEFIARRSSPIPLKKGHHLVAVDLYSEVENVLMQTLEKHNQLVDAFVDVYQKAVEKAKDLLGDQFNENDYPVSSAVKSYFLFTWEYLEFSTSSKLKIISKEAAERNEERFQANVVQAGQAMEQLLRAQMQGLVKHLVERLTPTGEFNEDLTEKKRVFRDSMLDKINDFLSVFDARNLTQSAELKGLVEQARALTQGITPEVLRSDEALRDSVSTGFTKIRTELDKMIQDNPTRAISFDEV